MSTNWSLFFYFWSIKPILIYYKSTTKFHSHDQCRVLPPCFFSGFPKHKYCGQFRGMKREMLHGCDLVRAKWQSVNRSDRMWKDRKHRTQRKEPNGSFSVSNKEGIMLTWNIWQSHETAYMAGIRFVLPGFSVYK